MAHSHDGHETCNAQHGQQDESFVSADHDKLVRQARRYEYLTVGWNVCEGALSLFFAVLAGSSVLYGFGIDACIEASSGIVLLWRLQVGELGEAREKLATKLVGVSLLFLAIYVLIDSVLRLYVQDKPEVSWVGLVIAGISISLMPWVSLQKRSLAIKIKSDALYADSRQTQLCAYLSGIVLLGLGLNAIWGWWWADPVAALCMVPIISQEAKNALEGKSCHCH
jgi:divalent metal cation (Fe/Co/Zn/Cd) transporter